MPELLDAQAAIHPFGRVQTRTTGDQPDRIIMRVPNLDTETAAQAAWAATAIAHLNAPKMSGESSAHFTPIWGSGFYGVVWTDRYVWFQEKGIRPFTMRSLAGKTIPMWVHDDGGKLRRENPHIKTRTRMDGQAEVLIFRRAAKSGARKRVRRRVPGGGWTTVDVPASYPGAPGRINRRVPAGGEPLGGQIAQGNVGVRWRHPGLTRKGFLQHGVMEAARQMNLRGGHLYAMAGR